MPQKWAWLPRKGAWSRGICRKSARTLKADIRSPSQRKPEISCLKARTTSAILSGRSRGSGHWRSPQPEDITCCWLARREQGKPCWRADWTGYCHHSIIMKHLKAQRYLAWWALHHCKNSGDDVLFALPITVPPWRPWSEGAPFRGRERSRWHTMASCFLMNCLSLNAAYWMPCGNLSNLARSISPARAPK